MKITLRKTAFIAPVIALALGAMSAPTPADAASHSYCVRYANSAVSQQNRNLNGRCGYFGLRWHRAWNLHYQWCRDTARWRARDERQLRRSMLRRCGA